jgi:hypothetical protein
LNGVYQGWQEKEENADFYARQGSDLSSLLLLRPWYPDPLNNINEIVRGMEKDRNRLTVSWCLNDDVQAILFDKREDLRE